MDDNHVFPQQDAGHARGAAPHAAEDEVSAEALFTQMQEAFQPLQQQDEQGRELPAAEHAAADEPIQVSGRVAQTDNNGRTVLIPLVLGVGAIAMVAGLYIASLPDSGDRPASHSVATTLAPADRHAVEEQDDTAKTSVVALNAKIAVSEQPLSGSASDADMNDTPAALPDESPVDAPVVSDDASYATETADLSQQEAPVGATEQAASTPASMSAGLSTPHAAEITSPQAQAAATPGRQSSEPSSRIAINDALDPANPDEQNKGTMTTIRAQKHWVINLASFLDAAGADRMLTRLRNDGLACSSTDVTIAGTVWHRIYLPGFSTVHQATKPMQELTDKYGFKGTWIGKAPVAE